VTGGGEEEEEEEEEEMSAKLQNAPETAMLGTFQI
jgi:hypothetical protein